MCYLINITKANKLRNDYFLGLSFPVFRDRKITLPLDMKGTRQNLQLVAAISRFQFQEREGEF